MQKNPLAGIDSDDEIQNVDEQDLAQDTEEVVEDKPIVKQRGKRAAEAPMAPGMNTGTLGDARIDGRVPMSDKGRNYYRLLLESPLVTSIIPPDFLNEDTEHVFCINSLRIIVPKGAMVQVPLMLANEIAQAFKNRV